MAGEVEQPRDGVAVRAVPRRRDRDRAGRVRGDHLDLDLLRLRRRAGAEAVARAEDLRERSRDPLVGEEQIEETRPGDLRPLDAGKRRRPSPPARLRSRAAAAAAFPRAAARRSSRSRRATRRVGRSSSTDAPTAARSASASCKTGSAGNGLARREQILEALDLVRRADADQHVADSIGTSGSGVVSNVPSGLRSAMMIAPVSWRTRSSRIVLPACGHGRRDLDLRELEVAAGAVVTTSRNAATCGLSTRFAIVRPALAYGGTTRSAPASRSFFSASSSDARATIVRSGRADARRA